MGWGGEDRAFLPGTENFLKKWLRSNSEAPKENGHINFKTKTTDGFKYHRISQSCPVQ